MISHSNKATIPKLRFPGFSGEWEVKKLGDLISSLDAGVSANSEDRPARANEKAVLKTSCVTTGNFEIDENKVVLDSTEQSRLKESVKTNTIVISRMNTPQLVGANAFVERDYDNVFLPDRLWAAKIRTSASPKWLALKLGSKQMRSRLSMLATGTSNSMKNITKSDVFNIKVLAPTKDEQEKIAEFLTVVDERIAAMDKKVGLLQQYKKGVMQKIFTQKLRFRDGNSNDYSDWQTKKLGELEDEELIKLGRGEVISKIDIAEHPGNYPIYSSSVKNEGLFGKYGKYMFDEELVTWSIDGGGHFFYRPAGKFSVTNVSGWLRVLNDDIICKFIALQLQSLHERLIFDYQTKAHPSVIRKLYELQIPSRDEQQKIADFLTSLDDKINLEKTKLEQAKLFKKSLLQRMFV